MKKVQPWIDKMTGAEWFDRFLEAFKPVDLCGGPEDDLREYGRRLGRYQVRLDAVQAAMKASGVGQWKSPDDGVVKK